MDLPTDLEARWVNNIFAKLLWVSTYIIVYGVRPLLIRPKVPGESFSLCLCLSLSLSRARALSLSRATERETVGGNYDGLHQNMLVHWH